MKKILFILVLFVCSGLSAQQYFFNGTVHVPKTTAEINAISSPVEGRQEANSDTGTIYYYNGSDWVDTGKPLVDASGFSGNLNSNITDLQLLAEAVDTLTISSTIPDGSITAAKLDAPVNASLDLADSALQSGDNVSELVNDAGYITEGGNLIPVTQAQYDSIALNHPQQILDNDYAIVDEDDGSGGGASQLSDLSDVGSSTPTNRNVLIADGTDWESRPLVEADISDLKQYLPLTGGTMSGDIAMGGNNISGAVNIEAASADFSVARTNNIRFRLPGGVVDNNRWNLIKSSTGSHFIYQNEVAPGSFATRYTLNYSGVPTNSTDLITKAYGDANYAPTGDSGTTGIVLEGTTSGTYTMSGQSWTWARSGNLVSFTIIMLGINGSDPVGSLAVNIDSTSFPPISSGYQIFPVSVSNFPIDFYWIQAKSPSTLSHIVFEMSNSLSNNNRASVANIDFTGTTEIQISGTYITND